MRAYIILILTIILVACATDEPVQDSDQQKSILERIPIVYRQDIQQGNAITQEMLKQLRPGLSKRQVRFIMGTPMLIDVFHQSRWDYVYTMSRGWGSIEIRTIQIYFNAQEQLERITGDLQSTVTESTPPISPEVLVSVPDYQDPNRGILKQAVEKIESVFSDTDATKNKK